MNDQAQILIVEDEEISAELTRSMLCECYAVQHAENGNAALEIIRQHKPNLVLLDVSMPGMSGYEVCRSIRQDLEINDLPIIFLSANMELQDRLTGYSVGGNDYLTKPVAEDELLFKIDKALHYQTALSQLKADSQHSFSTAMTALNTASEIGAVLQFLQASFKCEDYLSLCQEILNTLNYYGLEASIQIRGKQGTVTLGSNGISSPLEESILNHLFGHARIFEFSNCLSCSYEHITIVLKNLDRSDAERHGRMRDNIALLTEGANAKVEALDKGYELQKQHAALNNLLKNVREELQLLEQQYRDQCLESDQIFHDLQITLEHYMISLGLTEKQEEGLSLLIQETGKRAAALYDKGVSTESFMDNILKKLQ